jgi:hypothetical protein
LVSTNASEAAPQYFDGCLLTDAGYQRYQSLGQATYRITDSLIARSRHFRTTGDTSLDRDLDRALSVIADLFKVNPAFGFYDPTQFRGSGGVETNVMNAFATSENTDIPGTKGTVAFGWDLFQREFYQYDSSGMTIMAIAAHEFGHVVQSDRGYLSNIRTGVPLKSEINADFLSGYFLGARKRANPAIQFRSAGALFERLGVPGPMRTHGNSQERLDAAEAGFRVAYVDNKSLDDAVRAGLEYVGF